MVREGLLSYPDLNDFLVKGYAKQIKERNQATGKFKALLSSSLFAAREAPLFLSAVVIDDLPQQVLFTWQSEDPRW